MHSLRLKLLLACLSVAAVTTVVLGLLVDRATTGAFSAYVTGRATSDATAMQHMMDTFMGPTASEAMMRQMYGPAEHAYLASIALAVWLAGGVAALAAITLSLLLARQIAQPLRILTGAAQRMAGGDLGHRVPVESADEVGDLAIAFNALATALSRQQMLRQQMTADIAHELRTPLAVIQAELEAMLDGVRPLSTTAITEVHRETELLARLVTDLRDLSLAETGQLPLRRQPTALADLVRATSARFAAQGAEKSITLTVEAAPDLPRADVDPDRILQVLGNLFDNALRHTPTGGVIVARVDHGPDAEWLQITVRDTGAGIPPEHVANVFERFYRVDPSRSRAGGGSGIGLAVVKYLIEAHGGKVSVQSQRREGTTFTCLLPTARLLDVSADREFKSTVR